jgi:peptidoglycan L-alanyl-D-glutamate endopeptidase CwlK
MPHFSEKSQKRLSQCDPRIREIMNEVIKYYDCTIITGHRNEAEQMQMYNSVPQKSKVKWPFSKHNTRPSTAIDTAPWPIPTEWGELWKDRVKFYELKAIIFYEAAKRGTLLTWGGDWNSNKNYHDNTFEDLLHFQIRE